MQEGMKSQFSPILSITSLFIPDIKRIRQYDFVKSLLLIRHSKYSVILSKIQFYRLLFGDFAHWGLYRINCKIYFYLITTFYPSFVYQVG